MGQSILIAEPCELLRIGLRTIFAEDHRVSNIHEVSTSLALEKYLRTYSVELVVVNQSLITRISLLPKGNFVILTAKPDITTLKAAYEQGGRGYLSEHVSANLLRTTLDASERAFLIEPGFTSWVMDGIFGNAYAMIKEELLTPREREIIGLLRQGLDRPTIARNLCITEATLKTHLKNIARKREVEEYDQDRNIQRVELAGRSR